MTRRIGLTAVVALLWLTPAAAAAPALQTEDVVWNTGDVTLKGTLFLPPGTGRVPAALVLHGSGQAGRIRNRGSKVYLNHAERLTALGIAVLVYDKRGVGESSGSFRDAGFDVLADDAEGGMALLRRHPRIDPGRVGVVAVSQGGWLATMLEARGVAPAFFVMVTAGPPITPAAQEIVVQRNRLRRAGVAETEIEAALAVIRQSHQTFRSDAGWTELEAAAATLRARPWHASTEMPIPTRNETWWKWYASFMDYDPAPVLGRIRAPVFAAFGSRDQLFDSQDMLTRYAALPNQPVITARLYDAGHSLMVNDGADQPEDYWRDLTAWLRRHVVR